MWLIMITVHMGDEENGDYIETYTYLQVKYKTTAQAIMKEMLKDIPGKEDAPLIDVHIEKKGDMR